MLRAFWYFGEVWPVADVSLGVGGELCPTAFRAELFAVADMLGGRLVDLWIVWIDGHAADQIARSRFIRLLTGQRITRRE